MTSVLEKIIAIIAPHTCVKCGKENNIWCDSCRFAEQKSIQPACLVCGVNNASWQTCQACSDKSGLAHIWSADIYDGTIKNIIHKIKFERVRAAHEPLAKAMLTALPAGDWVVVPVPTAPPRMRQRGYDQAVLLARFIARATGMPYSPALLRVQYDRQVGKNRMQRQKQSTKMFCMTAGRTVRGVNILLVDDVCTTASTLSAAAHALRAAGAANVDAVVAAWQPPSPTASAVANRSVTGADRTFQPQKTAHHQIVQG